MPFAVACMLCLAPVCRGENSVWSEGFHVNGVVGAVRDMTVYDDGSGPALYVAGSFDAVGTQVVDDGQGQSAGILRWDGSSWSALPTPPRRFDVDVRHLAAVDEPGGAALYASGLFLDGDYDKALARWDGNAWTLVDVGPISSASEIADLCEWDDGTTARLAISGILFDEYNASIWQLEGSTWTRLGTPSVCVYYECFLHSVELGGQRLLVVSGNLTSMTTDGGTVENLNGIAAWNGSAWSPLGGGFPETYPDVNDVVVFDDGGGPSLYAGGGFRKNQGSPASRVARWTGSGWEPLAATNPLGVVFDLEVFDDGTGPALYAAGEFDELTGPVATPGVARWNGTSWSALDGGAEAAQGASRLQAFDGDLFVAASIDPSSGGPLSTLARWSAMGWLDVTPGAPPGGGAIGSRDFNGESEGAVGILAAVDLGTGPEVAALPSRIGEVFRLGTERADRVLLWKGTGWSALPGSELPVYAYPAYSRAHALAAFDDGSGPALYVGGHLQSAPNGQILNGIGRLGAGGWEPLLDGATIGVSGDVFALEVFDDGSGPVLAVGGDFASVGTVAAPGLAFWDGSTWSAPSPPLDPVPGGPTTVSSLDAVGDLLFVGGRFESAGGVTLNHVAAWDGSQWIALADGSQTGVAEAVAELGAGRVGGSLLVCATATGYHTPLFDPLDCWDGSSWRAVDTTTSGVLTFLALEVVERSGAPRLVGGGIGPGGRPAPVSLAVELDDVAWKPLGTSIREGAVHALEPLGDSLWVGGVFGRTGDTASVYVARVDPCIGSCALLFADGFESGDAGAWSTSLP